MGPLRTIAPADGPLCGTISVPGDKSIAHRALILNAMARGTATVRGLPAGRDVISTAGALRSLGVAVTAAGDGAVVVEGRASGLARPGTAINCGNSGTAMRLLMGVACGQAFDCTLIGDSSLSARPMERVAEPLRRMGAAVATEDGHAPVRIDGGALVGCSHELAVASAQVKSALLLAGMQASGRTEVVEPARSRDHTERMLAAMGVDLVVDGNRVAIAGPSVPRAIDIDVCGDPSSAAFFAVAASIIAGSDITVRGVCLNPTRMGFVALLRRMGADIRVEQTGTTAGEEVGELHVRSADLSGIEIGGADVPGAIDELPVLAVAAATASGRTIISGAGELRVKESDRIATVTALLGSLGASVSERPDGLEIEGGALDGDVRVSTAADHRVVMAAAIAALGSDRAVEIEDADAVAVSFPEFFDSLEALRS